MASPVITTGRVRPRAFNNLWVCRATLPDRLTVGSEYVARRFTHRFVSLEPSTALLPGASAPEVMAGVCSAVEIIDDRGAPLVFTERPSTDWHREYSELSRHFDTSPVIKNVSVPSSLGEMEARANFKFKPAQLDAATRLSTMESALLYADVGTGKTLIMLGVINILRPRRVLVVAKKGIVSQWIKEAERFGSHLKAQPLLKTSKPDEDGLFITYPSSLFYDSQDIGAGHRFDIVIYDEAHEVLGNIETHQCLRALKITARRRYALTGTPYSSNVDNLFPILGWLSTEGYSLGKTNPRFPFPKWDIHNYRAQFSGAAPRAVWSSFVAAANLSAILEPFLVRLAKEDCSEAPPKITLHVHSLSLDTERRKDYDLLSSLREQKLKAFSSTSKMRELVLTLDDTKAKAIWKRIAHAHLSSQPLVVVSPRHNMTDALRSKILGDLCIDGRTRYPAKEAKAFKAGRSPVLFMGTRCAQGYSFSHCNQLVIAGLDFSLASFWQTIGRVWRLDSVKDAHVHLYLYRNTLEENILNRILRRYDISYSLFGGTLPNVTVVMEGDIDRPSNGLTTS